MNEAGWWCWDCDAENADPNPSVPCPVCGCHAVKSWGPDA